MAGLLIKALCSRCKTTGGTVAFFLAIGGCAWAALLVLLEIAMAPYGRVRGFWHFVGYFGPGFAIWIGWICRAHSPLRSWSVRVLWVASIVVNGWYLLLIGRDGRTPIQECWWIAAVVLSAYALYFDWQRS